MILKSLYYSKKDCPHLSYNCLGDPSAVGILGRVTEPTNNSQWFLNSNKNVLPRFSWIERTKGAEK